MLCLNNSNKNQYKRVKIKTNLTKLYIPKNFFLIPLSEQQPAFGSSFYPENKSPNSKFTTSYELSRYKVKLNTIAIMM